jgi:hypothetical protein
MPRRSNATPLSEPPSELAAPVTGRATQLRGQGRSVRREESEALGRPDNLAQLSQDLGVLGPSEQTDQRTFVLARHRPSTQGTTMRFALVWQLLQFPLSPDVVG